MEIEIIVFLNQGVGFRNQTVRTIRDCRLYVRDLLLILFGKVFPRVFLLPVFVGDTHRRWTELIAHS